MGSLIDQSNFYWSSDGVNESTSYAERKVRMVTLANLIRKNRLICTKLEYEAGMKIERAFKSYLIRKHIYTRILKKKAKIYAAKKLKRISALNDSRRRSSIRHNGDDDELSPGSDSDDQFNYGAGNNPRDSINSSIFYN